MTSQRAMTVGDDCRSEAFGVSMIQWPCVRWKFGASVRSVRLTSGQVRTAKPQVRGITFGGVRFGSVGQPIRVRLFGSP